MKKSVKQIVDQILRMSQNLFSVGGGRFKLGAARK